MIYKPIYMVVEFGDNDFTGYVVQACEYLWKQINRNNGHLLSTYDPDRDIPAVFRHLHQAGSLAILLERTVYLFAMLGHVEHATRGLYWEMVDWAKHGDHQSGFADDAHYQEYITITTENISITTDIDLPEFTNGEIVVLSLDTGKCILI